VKIGEDIPQGEHVMPDGTMAIGYLDQVMESVAVAGRPLAAGEEVVVTPITEWWAYGHEHGWPALMPFDLLSTNPRG